MLVLILSDIFFLKRILQIKQAVTRKPRLHIITDIF